MNMIGIIVIAVIWFIVAVCIGILVGYWIGTNTIDHEIQSQVLLLRRLKDRAEDENKILKLENKRLERESYEHKTQH